MRGKLTKVKDIETLAEVIDELNTGHYVATIPEGKNDSVCIYSHFMFDYVFSFFIDKCFFEEAIANESSETLIRDADAGLAYIPIEVLVGGTACDYPDLTKTNKGWVNDHNKLCTVVSYEISNLPALKDSIDKEQKETIYGKKSNK